MTTQSPIELGGPRLTARFRAIALAAGVVLAAGGSARATDGRIAIYQQTTISQPGSYYVTRDITAGTAGPVVTIAADRVTLDLNGHTLTQPGGSSVVSAIGFTHVRVMNGTASGGATGVYLSKANGDFRVDHLMLVGQTSPGIWILGTAGSPAEATIEHNIVLDGTENSIHLDSVRGASVRFNEVRGVGSTTAGIRLTGSKGNVVADNTIGSVGSGAGLWLAANSDSNTIQRNMVSNCAIAAYLEDSDYNTLDWNTLSGNVNEGLYFFGTADNNVYAYNRIRNNSPNIADVGTGNTNGGGNN